MILKVWYLHLLILKLKFKFKSPFTELEVAVAQLFRVFDLVFSNHLVKHVDSLVLLIVIKIIFVY
jgi:hypothetical protein